MTYTSTQWQPVPGDHGKGVLLIENQGKYLRRDDTGWSRADSTGNPVDGDLPTEVVIRSPGGSLTHIQPVRHYGPPVRPWMHWELEDRP